MPRLTLLVAALAPDAVEGQTASSVFPAKDTVVQAHREYEAGRFRRFLMGDNYRDEWATPIRVPILDLSSYGGGLKAYRAGGGKATRSLRFLGRDSVQYVFRPLFKSVVELPDQFKNTLIWTLAEDGRSAFHPTGVLAPTPALRALGVIHPTPRLVALPNDSKLGEFRNEFAGAVGTLEEFPNVPRTGTAFVGALHIISDDDLLIRLNKDLNEQVDARAFLTAHLVDMLFGDADRHSGQWKWARFRAGESWKPIPRDRDWTFFSTEGLIPAIARRMSPSLISFDSAYAPVKSRFHNAIEFDRRLLGGLDRQTWDSIAKHVARTVTDAVLEQGIRSMPVEYTASSVPLLAKLKLRRDSLPKAALEYYEDLSEIVDLHASDAADHATIIRNPDGSVEVKIAVDAQPPRFARRFIPDETREIRVYLHNGDDTAFVLGTAQNSIPVRIIGGNGANVLVDSSAVGGHRATTHLYDQGAVSGVVYDTEGAIREMSELDSDDMPFNRRPWARIYGKLRPPPRDRGSSTQPIGGLSSGHGLGLVPRVGVAHYTYGFRRVPYATMWRAEAAYSTTNRWELAAAYDKRRESSGIHFPVSAKMSQLGIVEFRGFGNDVPDLRGSFYDVRERQWTLSPAVGYSFGPKSDVTVGPVLRYTTTDSVPNRFISDLRPAGFPSMGQVGVSLELKHDTRGVPDTLRTAGGFDADHSADPPLWGSVNVAASAFPSVWDTEEAYERVAAAGKAFLTFPVLTRPVLALRAGAEKLFGDFPYFDAAFLGGSRSLRTEHRQRFAGDAMLNWTTELRVPIARVPVLLPFNVGALGFVDAGRVYVDGESAGGWHYGRGVGLWIGVVNPAMNVNIVRTNNPDRRYVTQLGFAF
ncbi:MAG TPA: hypothetical protein VM099_00970 [Gemmatimonadaceae bacterium]|nr:hypothetical protein [Gemmatimonadaceae bacterium]